MPRGAIATAPSHIYQASDLNSKYRQVLNEARAGLARVRDTDGTSLVVLPESSMGEQTERLGRLEAITQAILPYIRLRAAVAHGQVEEWRRNSPWPWIDAFDDEDLAEFADELGRALDVAIRLGDDRGIAECLDDWKTTADAVSDDRVRAVLLGQVSPEDFFEADRPTEKAEAASPTR